MSSGRLGRWWKGLQEKLGGPTHSSSLVLWVLRGCFGAIMIGMALAAFDYFNSSPRSDPARGLQAFFVILSLGFFVLITDLLVRNKQITTISAVYFGLDRKSTRLNSSHLGI